MNNEHSQPKTSQYPILGVRQVKKTSLLVAGYQKIVALLNNSADQLPPFLLRLVLAYEFWEAGIMKIESLRVFRRPFSLSQATLADSSNWQ